ncbi:acyltransferase family protein [Rhizobium grahamii]|uniref:Acyltransferase 3 n=1 Tax=Rhizobium grahamii CCGE 502 TaxID=990285 RepID=S3HTG7_9HYPH|nr:acyltransferase [Rhizobium grahamii]EPE96506.1 acyltransferase 3 [Rhizobium grahamii CCGE 502]
MASIQRSTSHYVALDGVRGVAAISVLLFHLERWLDVPGLAANGNLAVDMFFTLSGFVLAVAYSERVHTMGLWKFVVMRAVRLMPLIILATIISCSYVLLRAVWQTNDILFPTLAFAAFTGALNIPYFHAPSNIGGPQLFPLNGPQFSLFLEVVANVAWWAVRFGQQIAIAVVTFVVSAICVIIFGIGGDTTDTFWQGFAHVGSSFALGVLIFHLDRIFSLKRKRLVGVLFWCLMALMLLVFYVPVEATFTLKLLWKFILAPALVWTGAYVSLNKSQNRVAKYLGDLSYPIYALHYPIFCWVNGTLQAVTGTKAPIIEVPLVVMTVIVASDLALRLFDKPVRNYLTRQIGARRSGVRAAAS